jgi:hypothetical protein
MAYLDGKAILARVRELATDGAGVARVIAANRFDSGFYEGQSDSEASRGAIVRPRIEARLVSMEAAEAVGPMGPCSLAFYRFALEVVVIRHLSNEHRLGKASRDQARGLAMADGSALAQCLTYPGNLPQSSTGVVSSCLEYAGSSVGRFDLRDDQPGLIETVHKFTGFARVTA